jgi:hypothetical protein
MREVVEVQGSSNDESVLHAWDWYVSLYFASSQIDVGAVLHPYLPAKWFKNTVPDPNDQQGRQDAVAKAETLFMHILQTYYENPPTGASESNNAPSPQSKSASASTIQSGQGFEVFDFEVGASMPVVSKDGWKEEGQHYLRFDGGCGTLDEPLMRWKVSMGPSNPKSQLILAMIEHGRDISHCCLNGMRLLAYTSNKCFR